MLNAPLAFRRLRRFELRIHLREVLDADAISARVANHGGQVRARELEVFELVVALILVRGPGALRSLACALTARVAPGRSRRCETLRYGVDRGTYGGDMSARRGGRHRGTFLTGAVA